MEQYVKLSVVIPAHNEEESLAQSILQIYEALKQSEIDHEILAVNDNSADQTERVLQDLMNAIPSLTYLNNPPPHGYGRAVRKGLDHFTGDCVAIMMADLSDSPSDLVRYYKTFINNKTDCVFGSRFVKGSKVTGYPKFKLMLNRIINHIVRLIFGFKYNDCTNAFKLYSRETIDGLRPLLSPHFNLTLELALKSIVRGYTYSVIPISWTRRKYGTSKLMLKEMGSRYFFIFLYCLIEKYFSKGDYIKNKTQ